MVSPDEVSNSDEMRAALFELLSQVEDPEIPVVNIVELGIVRDIVVGSPVQIILTPTYVGCPATHMITQMVRDKLDAGGFGEAEIKNQLSPAWTTDWITPEAKAKLKAYGIDPPAHSHTLIEAKAIATCPRCGSTNSKLVSEFGSTPCKAFYTCKDCLEPFDKFKCH